MTTDVVRVLLMQVGVPYLKVKVERLHSILTDENDSTPITLQRGQSTKQLLKFIVFKMVPYLQSMWTVSENVVSENFYPSFPPLQLSFFVFRFRYLLNSSLY